MIRTNNSSSSQKLQKRVITPLELPNPSLYSLQVNLSPNKVSTCKGVNNQKSQKQVNEFTSGRQLRHTAIKKTTRLKSTHHTQHSFKITKKKTQHDITRATTQHPNTHPTHSKHPNTPITQHATPLIYRPHPTTYLQGFVLPLPFANLGSRLKKRFSMVCEQSLDRNASIHAGNLYVYVFSQGDDSNPSPTASFCGSGA